MNELLTKPMILVQIAVVCATGIVAEAQNADKQHSTSVAEGAISVSGRDSRVQAGTPRKTIPRALDQPAGSPPSALPSVTPLGAVQTASAAESFALNGTIAYTCDDNEITTVDISNPASPKIVSTSAAPVIQNAGDIHCDIQRNTLIAFSDQSGSSYGNSPAFVAFSLSDPLHPLLTQASSINKRYFQQPVYLGNLAFVPTAALNFFFGWDNQYGDLLAVDLTDFTHPTLISTLEQPQLSATLGGPTAVLGVTNAGSNLLYLGGSTSTGPYNNGTGRLQTIDATNPAALRVSSQILVPGTIQLNAPLLQNTVGVSIGNNGGFVGSLNANPNAQGNIVVTVFDVTDRRSPAILSINTTSFKVGAGGGATQIGNFLFAFAGVIDANNNNVLLVVDASNPLAPVIQSMSIPQPFTSMEALGSTLYATLGSGGFATYSIPGIGQGATSVCPAAIDAILVIDRGANVVSTSFLNAKSGLASFIASLHLSPDQAGVVSFLSSANLDQALTTNSSQVDAAVNSIVAGANSFIGAGIVTAQQELTGTRHNPAAAPLMIVVSDGSDGAAPSGNATLSAALAARAAGIRVIAVQYGTVANTLMQSIASSSGDFYLVGQ